ncbi:MAG: FHA domain-containing protein [Myxococcales bacterium]|nr:FHA domain-containing protein [Myxococcales bacterium]
MAKLVYTEGGTQHEFVLEAGRSAFTIGRNPMCDLRINNPSISRKHAEIRVDAGGAYSIFDLNSSNGTYVNGRREQQADLKDGDELLIGEFEVLFVGAAPEAGARRAAWTAACAARPREAVGRVQHRRWRPRDRYAAQ